MGYYSRTEGRLLVVVVDGPENLIGKTAYWHQKKRTFGRQELFDLFGDFTGLEKISREHLILENKEAPNPDHGRDTVFLHVTDNNSTHGSTIELHPYYQFLECDLGFGINWVVECAGVIKFMIGEGFARNGWGVNYTGCDICSIPIDYSNICELCLKTKPITSFQNHESDFDEKETLDVDLNLISRKGWVPEGFYQVPGLTLRRGEESFCLTITEVEWLHSIIKENPLYRRMFTIYEDLT